jgi:putative addiction module component (TIGR02574 family)
VRVADVPEIRGLSTAEKILFVENLRDAISADGADVPVPESHRAELDRRQKASQNAFGALLSLTELQARIEERK